MPLKVSLTYSFNAHGTFGLPLVGNWIWIILTITLPSSVVCNGLIDNLWNDETASHPDLNTTTRTALSFVIKVNHCLFLAIPSGAIATFRNIKTVVVSFSPIKGC